jgi:hypothetical protein
MVVFHLLDKDHKIVREFRNKQDAYEYQNRIRPDTYLKMITVKTK